MRAPAQRTRRDTRPSAALGFRHDWAGWSQQAGRAERETACVASRERAADKARQSRWGRQLAVYRRLQSGVEGPEPVRQASPRIIARPGPPEPMTEPRGQLLPRRRAVMRATRSRTRVFVSGNPQPAGQRNGSQTGHPQEAPGRWSAKVLGISLCLDCKLCPDRPKSAQRDHERCRANGQSRFHLFENYQQEGQRPKRICRPASDAPEEAEITLALKPPCVWHASPTRSAVFTNHFLQGGQLTVPGGSDNPRSGRSRP